MNNELSPEVRAIQNRYMNTDSIVSQRAMDKMQVDLICRHLPGMDLETTERAVQTLVYLKRRISPNTERGLFEGVA